MMMLKPEDTILTAYAEPASGPGWSNQPVIVVVQSRDGDIRLECLQPVEQSRDMWIIYRLSAEIHRMMVTAVVRQLADDTEGKTACRNSEGVCEGESLKEAILNMPAWV